MSILSASDSDRLRMIEHTSSSHLPALNVIMGEMDILVCCCRFGLVE